jgi:enoyl-CoA hydratase
LAAKGKYFSAGGSFELFETMDTVDSAERMRRASRRLYHNLLDVDAPIVCAMTGAAYGAGASLVLLSDIVFASSAVRLSDPHVQRGLAAGDGAALWSMYLGPARAKRFLLTGEELTAEQAADLGLVSFVCEPAETLSSAREYAHKLAAGAPLAIAHTKMLCNTYIRDILNRTFNTGHALEMLDFRSRDHSEAVEAFRAQRAPDFKNA